MSARRNPFGLKTTTIYWILGGIGAVATGTGLYFALRKPTSSGGGGGGGSLPGGGGGGALPQGGSKGNPNPPPAPPGNGFNTSNPATFFASAGDYMNQLAKLGYNYQQIYNYLDYFGGVKMLKGLGIDLPTIQQIFSGIDLKSLGGALQGIDWASLGGALKGIDWGAFSHIQIG